VLEWKTVMTAIRSGGGAGLDGPPVRSP